MYTYIRSRIYDQVARHVFDIVRYSDEVGYVDITTEKTMLFDKLSATNLSGLQKISGWRTSSTGSERRALIFNGQFNSSLDIQGELSDLRRSMSRYDRIVAVIYNPYWRGLYSLLDRIGWRKSPDAVTFVTRVDLANIARISGFELVRLRPAVCFPWALFGLGKFIDGLLKITPILRELTCPVFVAVLRPVQPGVAQSQQKVSVVIPARNERGNIQAALDRMPQFPGADLEVIFIEGHSSDGTWEEIERVAVAYRDRFAIKTARQTGKGKNDAVRLGFGMATGDILMILDADLTMPPELLPRFFAAYQDGHGDFINGSRLVYPMEGEAMRFLNRLGNIFFAKALSWVLDVRIGDSLCGTKVVARRDYERIVAWRRDFGDFDPFGDFELLFPAAILGYGIVDIPVRYRDRTYGSTNIDRFRHGAMLAKMTAIGLKRIKLGW